MNTRMLEWILLAVGAALLLTYASARAVGELERREAVAAFVAPQPAPPDLAAWSPRRVAAWREARAATAGAATALLRVPGVALEVPVYPGTGERDLNRGAGHIPGTAAPGSDGNVGIAAHRDGYFRALKDIAVGDPIELVSAAGARTYEVVDLRIVDPSEVSVLAPTDAPALTLVTCYPFYFVGNAPQRYIVRAVAVD